jgi:hypothetical protein
VVAKMATFIGGDSFIICKVVMASFESGDGLTWWWAPARWFGILPKTGLDSESWRETGVTGFPYRNR